MLLSHKCKRDSGEQKLIFDHLDIDHNGSLSVEELTDALMLIKSFRGDRSKAQDEVTKILEVADMNRNGGLNYSEWVIASAHRQDQLSEPNLRFAFDFFDKNRTGLIGYQELHDAIGEHYDFDQAVTN